MVTFNPFFNNQLFPFGFNFPRFYNNRSRCRLHTLMGIPVLRTTGVSASSTAVSYTVNEDEFFSLPKEGIFFLDVRQSSPTGSSALPVALNDGEEVSTESLLKSGLQQNVPASDLIINGRYLIYYNRCTNNYQLINSYPATISASTVETTQEG